MSVYLIVNARITDQGKLDEYLAAVGPTLAGHETKVLVASNTCEPLEGEPGERTVVMEFADRDALRAWYDSPAYAQVRELRWAATEGVAVIADGL